MFDTNKQHLLINPNQKGQTLYQSNKSKNAPKEKSKAGGDPVRRRAKAQKQKALERQSYEENNEP